jgi:protein-L-isoaspartate(D-aspartate) O-methyltransferase
MALARLSKDSTVCGIDVFPELVRLSEENVRKSEDGREWLDQGRVKFFVANAYDFRPDDVFDAINVGAAAESVPECLLEQLAAGGRMVIPVVTGDLGCFQQLMQIDRKDDGQLVQRKLVPVLFSPLEKQSL